MNRKLELLREKLSSLENTIIAYSGGVDSTLLTKVAQDLIGERLTAVIVISPTLAERELIEARNIAAQIGVKLVEMNSEELSIPAYCDNSENRCYICKDYRYEMLRTYAADHGFQEILDGSNADDLNDYRPGQKAAQEHGVRSPLQEAGLTKAEIRSLAKELELSNWEKPSSACLASRIPYGTTITLSMLHMIEKAENFLYQLGFQQHRVRHHGEIARIEVLPEQFEKLMAQRVEIIQNLEEIGYTYITLDIKGFRSGSLNEGIKSNGPE